MKRFFVFAALAAFALTSCEQKIDIPAEIPTPGSSESTGLVFTATTESAVTKTALDVNYNVLWQNGDMITIVDGASHVGVYSTTSTTTQGEFTKVSGDMADTPSYTAYYPSTIYNGGTLTLPAEQTYVAENISGAPMMAVSSTTSLGFKNLVGIIKLSLTTSQSGQKVRSIALSANEGMSGPFTVTNDAAVVSGTAGVTLNCGTEGVAIGSTAIPFYIAVPAGTYSSLKITVTTTDGKVQTRTSNKGIEVGRSQITNITLGFNTLSATTDLSATESANTYIVSAAGTYKFKATVKGNGGLDPLTGTTATTINPADIAGVKVLWELYGQGRAIKHNGVNYDISYSNGYVYFSTPDSFVPGDACVAIYDNSDNILWSWVIWATPEPGEKIHNEKAFMDRNLGAIDVGNCMRGFLYQWGRKDAFSAANGDLSPYTFVPSASNVFSYNSSVQSMAFTIKNPTVRIAASNNSIVSWMPEEEYKACPWGPNKTIYDPCPAGWRIPTKAELDGITGLPATGLYDRGYTTDHNGFGNAGIGYYWSSTLYESDNSHAWYRRDNSQTLDSSHANGFAIRPVRVRE